MKERRFRLRAIVTSVVLHAVLFVLTWNAQLESKGGPGDVLAEEDYLELTLVPDEVVTEPSQPTEYTAVPERLATEKPPEQPDYLALHQSIAADQAPDGQDISNPAADQESEINKVAIQTEELVGAGAVVYSAKPAPQETSRPATPPAQGQEQEEEELDSSVRGELPLPDVGSEEPETLGEAEGEAIEDDPLQPEWIGGEAPSILKEGEQGSEGDRGFDYDQLSLGDVDGNVKISRAYSLNTTDWDYAPWMHNFEQNLYRHWIAPYAYSLGVISGETKIRLVVEMDGRPSEMELVDTLGHESLHQASIAALQAFAPYQPLPADFPEENLVIILTLHYPAWKLDRQQQRGNDPDQSSRR